jgi:dTDP-4-amino-4,6-dideoxygalactose transaminase
MVNVTKPFLPPLEDVLPYLEQIWASGVLSNNGPFHQQLERELETFLDVPHVSLFCNATIALITAQQALDIRGEVITTPYSFVATSHAITWMQNDPVFVDIDPNSLCIDPSQIEGKITDKTAAIMPLHCYGNMCDVDSIKLIADKYNLKIIYDACHSFGVEDGRGSALRHGDIAVVSFHATKVFNTFEGGVLVTKDESIKNKVDHLKNFGFVDETIVVESGINGKMSEFNAAVGLAQLPHMPAVFSHRGARDLRYRERLKEVAGIRCLEAVGQKQRNFAYFPIFIEDNYGLSRDDLYRCLRANDIYGRRYFYPLIPEFEMYQGVKSASTDLLPNAFDASRRVICLPLYPDLEMSEVDRICDLIASASVNV